jgi:hypothetical protein
VLANAWLDAADACFLSINLIVEEEWIGTFVAVESAIMGAFIVSEINALWRLLLEILRLRPWKFEAIHAEDLPHSHVAVIQGCSLSTRLSHAPGVR